MGGIKYIDGVEIAGKKILLRVDFNVSLNPDYTIADDSRIKESLPTINRLLENRNKLILIAHLGRPKNREDKFSLRSVAIRLESYLHNKKVILVRDFISDDSAIRNQREDEIIMLENIRFYPEEQAGDEGFAKKLSTLAEVYVNDAFGVSHRPDASVVAVTKFLPSYGGLLLKKEVQMISQATVDPKRPLVALIGGAKISTKIGLLEKLLNLCDNLIIGGGMANMLLLAQGKNIGKSLREDAFLPQAQNLLATTQGSADKLILPVDAVVADNAGEPRRIETKKISDIKNDDIILDIGPETENRFGSCIDNAQTIIWNGPVGYIERPEFRRGTDSIFERIAHNTRAVSVLGGGDTLAALSGKQDINRITHISTGGGAMLELIEKGTLPGIEALKVSAG